MRHRASFVLRLVAVTLIAVVAVTGSPFIALVRAMAHLHHRGSTGLIVALVTGQGLGSVAATLAAAVMAAEPGFGA